MANARFIKSEACILIYGKNWLYTVWEANNASKVKEAVEKHGKPNMIMKNFESINDMKKAKKCYEWQMSVIKGSMYYDMDLERPLPEEDEWFWQKQLDDEYFVNDIKEIVAKYDDMLPDSPDRYAVKKEDR